MRPFSIRIFVPSGDPDGIRVASRDDWTGRATIFPRELIGEAKGRKEFHQPGVYMLVGGKKLYIGEGDPVGDRLDRHVKEKAFWKKAVFFSAESGRLNKAHVQHLESRLISLAKENTSIQMENGNNPNPPALSEEEHAFAEGFLREIILMLPLLGFHQLDSEEDEIEAELEDDTTPITPKKGRNAQKYSSLPRGVVFELKQGVALAKLEIVEGGVSVLAGSRIVPTVRPHFETQCPPYAAQRRQLIESGIIKGEIDSLVFSENQFFSSGSAAASVVMGQAMNSDNWIGTDGLSLGDLLRKLKKTS